jgi:hypothetical protein
VGPGSRSVRFARYLVRQNRWVVGTQCCPVITPVMNTLSSAAGCYWVLNTPGFNW